MDREIREEIDRQVSDISETMPVLRDITKRNLELEAKMAVDRNEMAEIAEAEKQDFYDAAAEDDPKPPAHGLKLYEFKVLVKRDKEEEVTAGGIIKPQQVIERQEYAINTGIIVDMSPLAFTYEQWPEGVKLPKVGERVVFPKYAGADVTGKDGEEYRILNDKDIHAGYVD